MLQQTVFILQNFNLCRFKTILKVIFSLSNLTATENQTVYLHPFRGWGFTLSASTVILQHPTDDLYSGQVQIRSHLNG